MDIQQLRYFVEIVNSKSYTKASERLIVTQPMLTRAVQQLEGELGVQLIERTSRHFQVTDVGEKLYVAAAELLHRFGDIRRMVEDSKERAAGEVRLSTPGVLLDVYFSALLRDFYELYPNIDISVIEEGSKLTAKAIASDQADLGMVMLPVAEGGGFETETVIRDVCQVVVSKTHPFAPKSAVEIGELEGERILTFGDTATLHDVFIEACGREGFRPHIAYKSLMPNFSFEMVALGLCAAVLPRPVIVRYGTPDLAALPLLPEIPWEIAMISKPQRYQSTAAVCLREFIGSYFRNIESAKNTLAPVL